MDFHFHSDIVHYLQTIDTDPQYCVKTISSLPKAVTEQYYEERNKQGYEIPLNQGHLVRASAMVPEKPVAALALQLEGDSNKFELIGMPLHSFPTVQINYAKGYKEVIPKIFFLLTTFFRVNS